MTNNIKTENIPEMNITESKVIPGLYVIKRTAAADDRGFFREVYRKSILESVGINFNPVQMNHSVSETNVIRAIHAEKWNKLVYPMTGKMWAVIVDFRVDYASFGKYEVFEFDYDDNKLPNKVLYLPNGVGNSICALDGPVNYIYTVDAYWTPNSTFSVRWDDPDLNIPWPVKDPIMSEKDKVALSLRDVFPEKFK
jgi:dTDP-4-dehydrorhamnose 3,5-epimerase